MLKDEKFKIKGNNISLCMVTNLFASEISASYKIELFLWFF